MRPGRNALRRYLHALGRVRMATSIRSRRAGGQEGRTWSPRFSTCSCPAGWTTKYRGQHAGSHRCKAKGKEDTVPQQVEPLTVKFHGAMVLLYGDRRPARASLRIEIDGRPVEHKIKTAKPSEPTFDPGQFGHRAPGQRASRAGVGRGARPGRGAHVRESSPSSPPTPPKDCGWRAFASPAPASAR